jgi:hypothetical protein
MKKLHFLGLTFLLALVTSGCQLYFGDEPKGEAYCASDGYYVRGEWVSAQCPGGGNSCASNEDCAAACFCNEEKGICEETGFCATARDCPDGYICDDRSSCVPDGASCAGAIAQTCQLVAPKCAEGSVPLLKEGCYVDRDEDGAFDCEEITSCAAAPSCEARQHQSDCVSGTGCSSISIGRNCSNGGQPCEGGQPGCICETYVFERCEGPPVE